jgi:uncharacterized protein YjiS (DUF1127 family)
MTRLQLRTATQAPASIATRALYGDLPPLAPYVAGRFARALDTVLLWHERARQRRQLLQLDDVMLRDIGVGRGGALGEASKPFWRA